MTEIRKLLERTIDRAIEEGVDVSDAINLLDLIDDDPDLEDQDREPEVGEESELPPLMDGGWGYGCGVLAVFDQCPCCGHRIHEGYILPTVHDDAKAL